MNILCFIIHISLKQIEFAAGSFLRIGDGAFIDMYVFLSHLLVLVLQFAKKDTL